MNRETQYWNETETHFSIQLPVRGTEIEHIVIECANGHLLITAESECEPILGFQCELLLPPIADPARIEAFCKNGILHVSAPKGRATTRGSSTTPASIYYRVAGYASAPLRGCEATETILAASQDLQGRQDLDDC